MNYRKPHTETGGFLIVHRELVYSGPFLDRAEQRWRSDICGMWGRSVDGVLATNDFWSTSDKERGYTHTRGERSDSFEHIIEREASGRDYRDVL